MWRAAFLYLSSNRALRRFATHNGMARRIASRFVAGETVDQAIAAAHALQSRGASVEMDYLGENVTDAVQARAARDAYVEMLGRLSTEGANGHVSVKLTQMGLDVDEALCMANVEAIAVAAQRVGSFLWLDMEASGYTDITLSAYERLRSSCPNTGIALQAYMYRTRADLKHVLSFGGTVRLCKGAYAEPRWVAYPHKADVDRSYASLVDLLLSSGTPHAIATHDERMIRHTIEYAEANGIDKKAYEFQMLYGVRRDLQETLLAEGYQVRVYVPYGGEWYPYFMRRLAERPANLFFILGSIVGEGGRRRDVRVPAVPREEVASERR